MRRAVVAALLMLALSGCHDSIPPGGEVIDGVLYCPENTKANDAMDGCVPL